MKSMVPECMPITCSKPKAPENGGVSANGNFGGNKTDYLDLENYDRGNDSINCVIILRSFRYFS